MRVQTIYGYPGDGINGILGARARARAESIRFVQVRHEESAAFMAGAHAKWTREVGVCLATSGPGAIHLLHGLYDAQMDHQPVVAIVGQSARTAIGSDYQQEVDLEAHGCSTSSASRSRHPKRAPARSSRRSPQIARRSSRSTPIPR
jgi:pyruvate dehydrogenase (quinone)